RESASRKRAEVQALTDEGRKKLAHGAEWVASDGPASLTGSDSVAAARTDGNGLHGGDDAVGDADTGAGEPGARRAAAGGPAAADGGASRAGGDPAARGPGAMAGRQAPRCAVCGRQGRRVLPGPDRRGGPRGALDLLRCRGP